ncbi:MAG: hypothetical protein EOO43_01615 [Flavobacterium sp.]|nr:MAG: hypothetical protein EOO43_01615 [Flavobacterium sp.]
MDAAIKTSSLILTLSEKIKLYQKENKLSNSKLAKFSLLTEGTIRTIVNTNATNIELKTLIKLSTFFNTPLHELFVKTKKLKVVPASIVNKELFESAMTAAKNGIGTQITLITKRKEIKPEYLSLLVGDMDYSDTTKYLNGKINLTLLTIVRFSIGLKTPVTSILRY